MERARVRFDLNGLLSSRLSDVPNERYKDLLKLYREIETQRSNHAELLCEVTKRLPAAIVGRLLEILRDESDLVQGDDGTEAVRVALLK